MTLNEALRLINTGRENGSSESTLFLICGFQPLHLATFLQAHAMERRGGRIEIASGLFADLPGNIRLAAESKATTIAVVVEWDDLDPRLGLRSGARWTNSARADIEATCRQRLRHIAELLEPLATKTIIALAGPSLPLPPLGHTASLQATPFELGLQHAVTGFLQTMAAVPGIRVVDPLWLAGASPIAARQDPKLALLAGFPYSAGHAEVLADGLSRLLFPASPRKGLIVDLDDTLWAGNIGEVGVDQISWSLEHRSQVHALLQQLIGMLHENGVLLAIASKNEPAVVEQGLTRSDLLVTREMFFPVHVGWGPKSIAVGEILRAWNVGPESVVFLDDNPMELGEVETAFPEITALQFHPTDAQSVSGLLRRLRDLFGRPAVLEEDRVRATSVRVESELQPERAATGGAFLETLGGKVTISYRKDPQDRRPLELINKTNQFNLNGARLAEGDWLARLQAEETIAATISYEDKFGALGKIAAVLGAQNGAEVRILSWVMSCRAFSRHIEHHTLDSLFRVFGAQWLRFEYRATGRNQPVERFLQEIGTECSGAAGPILTLERFSSAHPGLPHRIAERSG
jgi:FkbH-like protein